MLYHDISRELAEKNFTYLSKNYSIISLNDFLKAVEGNQSLPPKALILTFDDGHIKNYEILPVIQKLNIPVTIFLCAAIIDTNRHFWFNHEHPYYSNAHLKQKTNRERLEILSENGFEREKEFLEPQALQREHIDSMNGFVDFQAHALYHPILPKCTNKEAEEEIIDSKKMLESKFSLNINAIAYPNGDYSERDIRMAKEANYRCGLTVDYGYNTSKTDLFRLKRLDTNDTDDINELIVKTSGVWDFFKTINGRRQKVGFTKTFEP